MTDTSLIFNVIARDKATATFDKIKGAAMVAGAAIGAALIGGAATGLEKGRLDAKMAAQLGLPAKVAGEFGAIAGKVYAAGVVSNMEEAHNALKSVWQNGLIAEDASAAEIEKVTNRVANLSLVMEEEAGRVSSAVSQMLRTGLVESAEEGFDLLQRGVEQGVNKSQDLLDTFNEYGTQFRAIGLRGPQAMGLLSQAIRAGARDSDVAADAIKEFAIRAIDGSKASADAYKALGLDAKKMAQQIAAGGEGAARGMDTVLDRLRGIEDPVKRNAAAVGLFGTKAEDLGEALYAMDLDTASDALGRVEGAAARAGQTLQSDSAKLEQLKRSVQGALVEKLAQAVPHIERTFGWLSRNQTWLVPLVTGLAGLAAIIYGVVTAMKIWATVQTVLNLALWTSPITWIVAGILLLVVAVVWIATKTTWFQTIWNTAWGAIKKAAAAVWNWVKSNWPLLLAIITGPIGMAVYIIARNWDKIKAGASAVKNWVVLQFNSLVSFIKSLPGRISGAARGLFNGIRDAFRSAINWIISKWNGLSFTLPSVNIPGLGRIGGGTLSTPNLPYLDVGGDILRTGLAVVHRGERVVPAAQVTRSPSGGGGGGTFVLAGDGSRIAELLIEILRLAIRKRGGNVQLVLGGRGT